MTSKNKLSDVTVNNIKTGKLEITIPEFYKLKNVIENNDWHNNQNVFDHTLNVLKELKKTLKLSFIKNKKIKTKIISALNSKIGDYSHKELLFLAALLHDIAKLETIQTNDDKKTSCPQHEIKGSLKAEQIASRFDLSKDEILFLKKIIQAHGLPHIPPRIPANKKGKNIILKNFRKIKKNYQKIYLEILLLGMADVLGSDLRKNYPKEFKVRIDCYKKFLNDFLKN